MSVDLTVNSVLSGSGQYVTDQNGNASSLSLTKNGNVGVGVNNAAHTLDVNGTLRIRSTNTGFGLHFVGSDYSSEPSPAPLSAKGRWKLNSRSHL